MDATSDRNVDAVAQGGLSPQQVAERVSDGRTNAFEADTSRTWWNIVRANVFTLFNAIVFACFAALLVLGRWQDALFGLAAIFNALIGCFKEIRAKMALDRLALLNAPRARVRRSGKEQDLAPAEVVQDDVLVLRSGDQVPADAELLDGRGLQVDESMLTGEADPVDKHAGDELLSGSTVVGGQGDARAVRVGADSYANRFAGEARKFSLVASELRRGVNRVLAWVAWGIGPVALLVTNSQVQVQGGWRAALADGTWRQAAVDSIAIITAMIPLGLVLLTSITFAVGAAKLAREKVLVQELPAVEGLARVDTVCLDKTGTLTYGDIGFDAVHPLDESGASGWRDAAAWFGAAPDANATAHALAEEFALERETTPAHAIPFSSRRKWSAVSFTDGPVGTWALGAPTMIFTDAADRPVPWAADGADTAEVPLADVVRELASTGRRTLLLAHSPVVLDEAAVAGETLPGDLHPVALMTLNENIREDAAQTLAYFAEQGVEVRIISGDDPNTVAAIARRLGLEGEEGYDARQLPEDETELGETLEQHRVLGRVSPEQKKGIVSALQARGRTVAMTGDGVNDALAIKHADIGIAMNSGAAATKAVARLVLLDGRFSHLPAVVAEGRQVIANMERVSMVFLTKTAYATTLAVLFGVLVMQIPFLPRQLSITDGLTIGIPAFFIALLPATRRYIPGFLRRSLSFAIPAGITIGLALTIFSRVAVDFWSVPMAEVRTGTTLMVGILGLWVLCLVSFPLTWIKGLILAAMIGGLVLVMNVPITVAFFELEWPREEAIVLGGWLCLAGIVLIGIIRAVQQTYVRRLLADAGPR